MNLTIPNTPHINLSNIDTLNFRNDVAQSTPMTTQSKINQNIEQATITPVVLDFNVETSNLNGNIRQPSEIQLPHERTRFISPSPKRKDFIKMYNLIPPSIIFQTKVCTV